MKKLSDITIVPKWEACEQCKPHGWVSSGILGAVKRCPCVVAHQQRVADALKSAKVK